MRYLIKKNNMYLDVVEVDLRDFLEGGWKIVEKDYTGPKIEL